MTARLPSLSSSKTRSLGIGTLLLLMGAAFLPIPGCSDEPTPRNPTKNCAAAELENSDPKDCTKPVCQNGTVVNEPDDTEIPDDGKACTKDTCSGGQAKHEPAAGACMVGTAAGMCTNGECKVSCTAVTDCNDNDACTTDACDTATSTCTFTSDPASYTDNNDCTIDSCAAGMVKHDNAPANTACGASGNGKCDGNGVCKGCTMDSDCPQETCIAYYCDLATTQCQPMNKPNGDLMDDMVGDCKQPACMDGALVHNNSETDVLNDNNECTMDSCTGGMPMNEPLPVQSPCATGVCSDTSMCVQCVAAADCMGDSSCSMNMCFSRTDNTQNGTESDVDCGRDCATKCVDTKKCTVNEDCFYGTCDNMTCVSCFDGAMNSTESDVDCGGVCGATCGVNKKCNSGADCMTGVCNMMTKVCSAPTCADMVKNGTETDVDCGGACTACGAGKMCKIDKDCSGNLKCVNGTCG